MAEREKQDRQPPAKADEDAPARRHRQLIELLNETRVAMPGVQVLFGFLLAVPFQQRFAQTTPFQRDLYLATVLLAALSTVCFIAPAAYHRIMFEQGEKQRLIALGNRFLIWGFALLALAMVCAVALVCDVIFHAGTVVAVSLPLAAAFGWLWFGMGLTRRAGGKRRH
jgi:hypothetical protein